VSDRWLLLVGGKESLHTELLGKDEEEADETDTNVLASTKEERVAMPILLHFHSASNPHCVPCGMTCTKTDSQPFLLDPWAPCIQNICHLTLHGSSWQV
jgi:hypothetical protein